MSWFRRNKNQKGAATEKRTGTPEMKNPLSPPVRKLPTPETQDQEVFFMMLDGIPRSRKDFMDESWVFNAPACILRLRRKGVEINLDIVNRRNKFGREVKPGYYSLADVQKAKEQYIAMFKKP